MFFVRYSIDNVADNLLSKDQTDRTPTPDDERQTSTPLLTQKEKPKSCFHSLIIFHYP